MKRLLKVMTCLLLLLAVGILGTYLWQRENIKSVLVGVYEDSVEIERQRYENQAGLVKEVNDYMDVPVREFTEEEKQRIDNGEISATDVYEGIFQENTGTTEDKGENAKLSDKDSIISKYMAQLYNLQNTYTARAEALISQGASYYESIKTGSGDASARAATISRYTPMVRSLESECDGKVEAVITNLKNDLNAIGADTSITETIRATYTNEKQLKLSYYANKYLD